MFHYLLTFSNVLQFSFSPAGTVIIVCVCVCVSQRSNSLQQRWPVAHHQRSGRPAGWTWTGWLRCPSSSPRPEPPPSSLTKRHTRAKASQRRGGLSEQEAPFPHKPPTRQVCEVTSCLCLLRLQRSRKSSSMPLFSFADVW